MQVISERKALVMSKTVSCHACKEQFYVILENLNKVHNKVKRRKIENCRSESEYIKVFNSYSIKPAVALDFRQLLQYRLCLVPLSMVRDVVQTKAN